MNAFANAQRAREAMNETKLLELIQRAVDTLSAGGHKVLAAELQSQVQVVFPSPDPCVGSCHVFSVVFMLLLGISAVTAVTLLTWALFGLLNRKGRKRSGWRTG